MCYFLVPNVRVGSVYLISLKWLERAPSISPKSHITFSFARKSLLIHWRGVSVMRIVLYWHLQETLERENDATAIWSSAQSYDGLSCVFLSALTSRLSQNLEIQTISIVQIVNNVQIFAQLICIQYLKTVLKQYLMCQITNFKHFAKFVLPYSLSIHAIFNTHTHLGLSCRMWDLQLQHVGSTSLTRIKPRLLALGVQSLATGPPGMSHTQYFS